MTDETTIHTTTVNFHLHEVTDVIIGAPNKDGSREILLRSNRCGGTQACIALYSAGGDIAVRHSDERYPEFEELRLPELKVVSR